MQRSLSVLLPVHNAQATLAATVDDLLDVLADSIERFELLIIDDGSTDATGEIAAELTRHYPQVRVMSHGVSMGREAALQTGLKRSQGEVVVVRDDKGEFQVLERRPKTKLESSRPARPNYLGRLRNFVINE